MKLIKVKNYSELSEKACEIIVKEIQRKPNLILGFATGKTPLGLYRELVKSYRQKKIDFSKVKSFNLDEYYPISKKNKNSYYYYMFSNLFSKVNIKKQNITLLDGETKNPLQECLAYEKKIKNNRIDVQILGVGVNGHIGFNEPGSAQGSGTRLVELSKETWNHNSKISKNKKLPHQALTEGIKTTLSAKKIILLASGKDKRKAVKHLLKGKADINWPITGLKKHKNLIIIVDRKAFG